MAQNKRKVEIFSAGCPACEETIALVRALSCESCEVTVHDMRLQQISARAKELGIRTVPAVVINGKLADCCSKQGPNPEALRAAGLGVSLG